MVGQDRFARREQLAQRTAPIRLMRHGPCYQCRMASNRTIYHVVPDAAGDCWLVTEENAEFREEYETKAAAVEAAKTRARHAEPSQVKVHKHDGNMEYESTYGDDPPQSPN